MKVSFVGLESCEAGGKEITSPSAEKRSRRGPMKVRRKEEREEAKKTRFLTMRVSEEAQCESVSVNLDSEAV